MSDRPIQVGDLVVVVRAHCVNSKAIGRIFVAQTPVKSWTGKFECGKCGHIWTCDEDLFFCNQINGHSPRSWLKLIPPLSELEGTRTDEPTKETA